MFKKIFLLKVFQKKKTYREKCLDEVIIIIPYSKFKSNAYSDLYTILNNIKSRFVLNEMSLKDLNWLDPKIFPFIDELEQVPKNSLNTICKLANWDQEIIATMLKQFACQYSNFVPNVSENDFHDNKSKSYKIIHIDEDEDENI